MNNRKKKKLFPKDTYYCYTIHHRDKNGTLHLIRCPHYRMIGYVDDEVIDTNGEKHACKTPIVYCSYVKVSSEEDYLLIDDVKTCGERLQKCI